MDSDVKEFLSYVEQSSDQVAQNSKSELVRKVHEKVELIRSDEESEVEFMTFMEKQEEAKERGREIGLEQGREIGLKESKVQVTEKMLEIGIELEKIIQVTGFTKEEIEQVRKEMLK